MSPAGTGSQVLFPQVLQSSRDLGSCGNVVGQEIEPRRNEAGRPSSRRVGGVEW